MKKLSLLLLTVAAVSVLFTSCTPKQAISDRPNLLRLSPVEGSSYNIHTHTTQTINTHVGSRDIKSHMKIGQTMNLSVVKKYEQDSLQLHLSYQHVAFKASVLGNVTSFDSDSSKKANNSKFSDIFNKIKNSHFTVMITPRGKVLNIRGLKDLKTAIKNKFSFTSPVMKKMFNKMLNKQKLKTGFFNIGIYPKKPISEGTQWNNVKTVPSKIPMTLHTTYTVKKIQPNSILLGVKGKLANSKDSVTIRGMKIPVKASGTQTGTYTINRSTGLISSGNLSQNTSMTMSMIGRSIKIDIKGKTTISTTKADK